MKKFLLTILTFCYLMVSSGVAMEIHYCMGKKAGVDFYKSSSDKCGRCGMTDKKSGCCNDEHKFYKLQDAHKISSNDVDLTFDACLPQLNYAVDQPAVLLETTAAAPLINSPPGSSVPLFILYRDFRI